MISVDKFLAHHGVKGMKWGRRKAESAGGAIVKAINKHVEERDASDNKIHNARANMSKEAARYKQAKKDFKGDKAKYKQDKVTLGKAKAKAIFEAEGKTKLWEARRRLEQNRKLANQETSAERTQRIIREAMEQHLGPIPSSATANLMEARRAGYSNVPRF